MLWKKKKKMRKKTFLSSAGSQSISLKVNNFSHIKDNAPTHKIACPFAAELLVT